MACRIYLRFLAILLTTNLCSAQLVPRQQKASATSASSATKGAAFQFIRGKLLSLSSKDGANGIQDVTFDEASCRLNISQESWSQEVMLQSLDANAAAWDILNTTHKVLILRVFTKPNGTSIIYRSAPKYESQASQHVSFNFDLSKAAEVPNFQAQFSKAVSQIIKLCGGSPEITSF